MMSMFVISLICHLHLFINVQNVQLNAHGGVICLLYRTHTVALCCNSTFSEVKKLPLVVCGIKLSTISTKKIQWKQREVLRVRR